MSKTLDIILIILFVIVLIVQFTFVYSNSNKINSQQKSISALHNCKAQYIGTKSGNNWISRDSIDTNNDNVVTGNELCSNFEQICLFTQEVSHNVKIKDDIFRSLSGPPTGCAGGENFDFYQTNIDEARMAWCCPKT